MSKPRGFLWSALFALNLAVLLSAFGAGWSRSARVDERLYSPRTDAAQHAPQAAVGDAWSILVLNSRALGWIVVFGAVSAGGYGLLQLGVHGYAIGYSLSAASRSVPSAAWHVLSYAPLEFAAFVMGNCAAQAAFYCGCNWLRARPAPELRNVLLVVGGSLLALAVAAGLEAHAIQRFGTAVQ